MIDSIYSSPLVLPSGMLRYLFQSIATLLIASLSACSTVDNYLPAFIKTYRIDIQQGNMVSQEMVNQLKIGMTPEQVRFILGTPLITDPFRPNRWEYVFRLQRGTGQVEQRNFAVVFADGRLASFAGDTLPDERKGQQSIVSVGRNPNDIKIEELQNTLNPLGPDLNTVSAASTNPTNNPAAGTSPAAASALTNPSPPTTQTTSNPAAAIPLTPEVETSLRETVEAWRSAWSQRLPQEYLSFYSPNYKIENMDRATWEKNRRETFLKASQIEVTVSAVTIELLAEDMAKISFQQTFASDLYQERGSTTLFMRKIGARWLIEFEQFAPQ